MVGVLWTSVCHDSICHELIRCRLPSRCRLTISPGPSFRFTCIVAATGSPGLSRRRPLHVHYFCSPRCTNIHRRSHVQFSVLFQKAEVRSHKPLGPMISSYVTVRQRRRQRQKGEITSSAPHQGPIKVSRPPSNHLVFASSPNIQRTKLPERAVRTETEPT